ncbi:hypothetical protein [Micromonospora palythoicola]|uniref:hypothetical protein n=1 Tax=Micromonospora palythoicola TaxID=3120507 RepID=UPI002FCE5F10
MSNHVGIAEASPADPFTITGALVGLPIFLAWAVALPVAGWSYFRRTRRAAQPFSKKP